VPKRASELIKNTRRAALILTSCTTRAALRPGAGYRCGARQGHQGGHRRGSVRLCALHPEFGRRHSRRERLRDTVHAQVCRVLAGVDDPSTIRVQGTLFRENFNMHTSTSPQYGSSQPGRRAQAGDDGRLQAALAHAGAGQRSQKFIIQRACSASWSSTICCGRGAHEASGSTPPR